jgi:hypothetical protein
MADVILSSDDLTVLGGPAEISVDLDFGPQGDRGSLMFVGNSKPEIFNFPETPRIYDTYINLLTSDDEYLFMYQYVAGLGGLPSWVKLLKLIPNAYSLNTVRSFNSGQVQINIPVSTIVSDSEEQLGSYNASNFNVQCNVLSTNPVSVGVSIGEIQIYDNLESLPITISGVEYSDEEWISLAGQKTIHLYITVV